MDKEEFKTYIRDGLEDVKIKSEANEHDLSAHNISHRVYEVSKQFLQGREQELRELNETFLDAGDNLEDALKKELVDLHDQSGHTPIDAGKRNAVKELIERIQYEQSDSEREDIDR